MMCGGVPAALAVAAAAVAIWFALTAPFAETVVRRLYPGPPHCDATGCLSFPMDWAGPRDWSGHMTPTSATGTVALATDGPAAPYVITVRDDDLNDLTHRLERYRGPGAPLPRPPGDWGSGMPAEEVARLVEVWRTTYDWRYVFYHSPLSNHPWKKRRKKSRLHSGATLAPSTAAYGVSQGLPRQQGSKLAGQTGFVHVRQLYPPVTHL